METRTVWGLGIRQSQKISGIIALWAQQSCLSWHFLCALTTIGKRATKKELQQITPKNCMQYINVTLQWGETPFYDAGERHLKRLKWEHPTLPDKEDIVNVIKFMDACSKLHQTFTYKPHETFVYNERNRNIFEWIQQEHCWQVEKRGWEIEEEGVIPYFLVTDKGYYM